MCGRRPIHAFQQAVHCSTCIHYMVSLLFLRCVVLVLTVSRRRHHGHQEQIQSTMLLFAHRILVRYNPRWESTSLYMPHTACQSHRPTRTGKFHRAEWKLPGSADLLITHTILWASFDKKKKHIPILFPPNPPFSPQNGLFVSLFLFRHGVVFDLCLFFLFSFMSVYLGIYQGLDGLRNGNQRLAPRPVRFCVLVPCFFFSGWLGKATQRKGALILYVWRGFLDMPQCISCCECLDTDEHLDAVEGAPITTQFSHGQWSTTT